MEGENPAYSSLDGVLFNVHRTKPIQFPGGRGGAYLVPDGVSTIADGAFWYCDFLTNLTVADTVTEIGASFSYRSRGLVSVTIPDSVVRIGDSAFYYCTSLRNAKLGTDLTSVGSCASPCVFQTAALD